MIAQGNTASAKAAARVGITPAREETFPGEDVVVRTPHRPGGTQG
ncbi:hypothetical protein SALCHL_005454 [Streptomyces albus subsp. chlorinus]|nr:hypothetical protein [Streptomyces albus]